MTNTTYVVVLTTWPVDADVCDVGRTLVNERLAACVTILDASTAIYRWQGQICEDRERPVLIKTAADRLDALEARIRGLHPDDVPEFLVLPASGGSPAYLAWMRDGTLP
jgi:periplasmic divalent cation tolerance protein